MVTDSEFPQHGHHVAADTDRLSGLELSGSRGEPRGLGTSPSGETQQVPSRHPTQKRRKGLQQLRSDKTTGRAAIQGQPLVPAASAGWGAGAGSPFH